MKSQKGITLIEISIILGIIALLNGFTTLNFFRIQHNTSLDGTIDILISDLKQQQIKAMIGDTEGRSQTDNYGIYFTTDSYTLFHGNLYIPGDPSNISININQDNMQFVNINFPSSTVLFSIASGEISGFINGSDSIKIKHNLNQEEKTIKINRYGVITQVQ